MSLLGRFYGQLNPETWTMSHELDSRDQVGYLVGLKWSVSGRVKRCLSTRELASVVRIGQSRSRRGGDVTNTEIQCVPGTVFECTRSSEVPTYQCCYRGEISPFLMKQLLVPVGEIGNPQQKWFFFCIGAIHKSLLSPEDHIEKLHVL